MQSNEYLKLVEKNQVNITILKTKKHVNYFD